MEKAGAILMITNSICFYEESRDDSNAPTAYMYVFMEKAGAILMSTYNICFYGESRGDFNEY